MKRASSALSFIPVMALLGYFNPAWAGFEWIPPKQGIPAKKAPVEKEAIMPPLQTLDSSVASPSEEEEPLLEPIHLMDRKAEVRKETNESRAIATMEPIRNKDDRQQENRIVISPAESAQTPQSPAPTVNTTRDMQHHSDSDAPSDYADVNGFGADMPLAFALRQVVPAEYAFSFGPNVNPGYRVSWSGGQPWNIVVQDMIAPLKLASQIHQKTVIIYDPEMVTTQENTDKPAETDTKVRESTGEPITLRRTSITDPGLEAGIQSLSLSASEVMKNRQENTAKSKAVPAGERTSQSPHTITTWEASAGTPLKEILQDWTSKAGLRLIWSADENYTVDKDLMVEDTFRNALQVLTGQGLKENRQPLSTLVLGTSGNNTTQGTLTIKDRPSG